MTTSGFGSFLSCSLFARAASSRDETGDGTRRPTRKFCVRVSRLCEHSEDGAVSTLPACFFPSGKALRAK
jgi:hypothetical protein